MRCSFPSECLLRVQLKCVHNLRPGRSTALKVAGKNASARGQRLNEMCRLLIREDFTQILFQFRGIKWGCEAIPNICRYLGRYNFEKMADEILETILLFFTVSEFFTALTTNCPNFSMGLAIITMMQMTIPPSLPLRKLDNEAKASLFLLPSSREGERNARNFWRDEKFLVDGCEAIENGRVLTWILYAPRDADDRSWGGLLCHPSLSLSYLVHWHSHARCELLGGECCDWLCVYGCAAAASLFHSAKVVSG